MSDFDDSKKVEDMPLADLLGMSGADERVQERDDEPGSGIARLAQMVAATSVNDAKKPSLAPPGSMPPTGSIPAPAAPIAGSIPPAASVPPDGSIPAPAAAVTSGASVPAPASAPPAGSIPPMGSIPPGGSMPPAGSIPPAGAMPTEGVALGTGAMPAATSMAPSAVPAGDSTQLKKMGIIAGSAVAVIIAIVVAVALSGGEDTPATPPPDTGQMAALEAKLKELENKQNEPDEVEPEKAAPVREEPKAQAAVADEPPADAQMEFTDPAPVKHKKRGSGVKKRGSAKSKKAVSSKASTKKTATKSKGKAKGGVGGLDDLLQSEGGKKKETASAESKLPKTPSKTDVKAAMRPVVTKAAKCSRYSKGSVKLKIIVASNGRVKAATSTGGSASAIAANCVTMMARTAKFPKFSNSTFTVNYPISLK